MAEAITLNLRIPQDWQVPRSYNALSVSPPPSPPKFERQSTLASYHSSLGDILTPPRSLPTFPEQPDRITGPDYMQEGNHLVGRFRIDSLTHGDNIVSAEPLLLIPDAPGTQTLTWTAHVGNLRRPATGEITIEIEPRPVPEDAPLRTVAEVLATNDVKVER